MQGQLKLLHWQTESYAEHIAFGNTYDTLDDLFDTLVETYAGKYQRPKFGKMQQLSFTDYADVKIDAYIEEMVDFMSNAFIAEQDSELANIRDEIKAALAKLKYLLTLK
jgi:hypothetical protein